MEIRAVDAAFLSDADDETLAARSAEDFEAFAELYRRYACVVFRVVRARTPSEDVAEDITAHVFFKALVKADEWRGEGNYRSWLYGIARNAVSTWRRDHGSNAVGLEIVPDIEDPVPTPPHQVVIGEERDLIWKRVAELPDAQREAVVLRYLKEHSIDEIASITKRTKGAVRILLHRARSRLRRQIESMQEEPEKQAIVSTIAPEKKAIVETIAQGKDAPVSTVALEEDHK
ncbi:MAG: RNA polymerase sigma factor [Actinomycetota bacterium]